MEFSEDSIDRTLVFKGKRSKRPRQFMAVAMVTSTSSTAGDGGVDGGSDDGGGGGETYYSSIQCSPTTSTTQISTSSTEEDEDMANCLILLAQSGQCQKLQVERSSERKMVKISSRKFTEMATTTNGKAGFYVYECKTCNRTFPSFQALGGHRTSHKKIKTVTEEKKSTADSNSPSQGAPPHPHHQQQQQQKDEEKFNRIITPSISLMNSKPKIHECSICGAEFSSGQALGGHMRRHRPPTITTTTNTKITVEETSNTSNSSHHDDDNENSKDQKKPKIFLSLDLNLPASPEDDHQRDANFEFSANKQNLVFSAAPLVDCHY